MGFDADALLMSFNTRRPHISEAAQLKFEAKYPALPGETESQWFLRNFPRLPDERLDGWLGRVAASDEWMPWITYFPPLDTPIGASKEKPGFSNVYWDRGVGVRVMTYNNDVVPEASAVEDKKKGLMLDTSLFMTRLKICGEHISNIQKVRPDQVREVTGQPYINPGIEEKDWRYGDGYVQQMLIYAMLRHLRIKTMFDSQLNSLSWPFTNRVFPTPGGLEWGSQLMPVIPWSTNPSASPDDRATKIPLITDSLWPCWNVVPSKKWVSNKAQVQCSRLDNDNNWTKYAAMLFMEVNDGSCNFKGWMSPAHVIRYIPRVPDGVTKGIEYYRVPSVELRPMESLFRCLEGWDEDALRRDKLLI